MIINMEYLSHIVEKLKLSNKKIVLCNGTFDLLHLGHIYHLKEAKSFGDILIVAVLNDGGVLLRKGKGRPIFNIKERLEMVDSVKYVDYTIENKNSTGIELIKGLKPDIYVKGIDYKNKQTKGILEEMEAIKAVGGKIKYTQVYNSSRNIIKYIKESC